MPACLREEGTPAGIDPNDSAAGLLLLVGVARLLRIGLVWLPVGLLPALALRLVRVGLVGLTGLIRLVRLVGVGHVRPRLVGGCDRRFRERLAHRGCALRCSRRANLPWSRTRHG